MQDQKTLDGGYEECIGGEITAEDKPAVKSDDGEDDCEERATSHEEIEELRYCSAIQRAPGDVLNFFVSCPSSHACSHFREIPRP